MLHEFRTLPAVLPGYWRALLSATKPSTASRAPLLMARVRGVEILAERVARFRQAFELPAAGEVPPTFAHLLAGPLQLRLLTDPAFPLRVLGTVHLRNPIRQYRPLRVGERVDLSVSLGNFRETVQGTEHDLRTEVHDADGALIWQGVSTNLLRRPPAGPRPPPEAPLARTWERAWRLWLAAGTGRHYASLSGDWNPIHLSAPSARLFGFRRAIIHGMWTYARVLAALEPHLDPGVLDLDVQFRRPLMLPGAAVIRARRVEAAWEWVVQDATGRIVHAQGRAATTTVPTAATSD